MGGLGAGWITHFLLIIQKVAIPGTFCYTPELVVPAHQKKLIQRVVDRARRGPKNPYVHVLVHGGGALDVEFLQNSTAIHSMVWVGYPGQAGGRGIADLLLGNVSPSGRLTQTWYRSSFLTQQEWKSPEGAFFDYRMAAVANETPGRGYRFYTGAPIYTFGHGLSYAKFALLGGPRLKHFRIRNDGAVRSRVSALVFVERWQHDHAVTTTGAVKNNGTTSSSSRGANTPPAYWQLCGSHAVLLGRGEMSGKFPIACGRVAQFLGTGFREEVLEANGVEPSYCVSAAPTGAAACGRVGSEQKGRGRSDVIFFRGGHRSGVEATSAGQAEIFA